MFSLFLSLAVRRVDPSIGISPAVWLLLADEFGDAGDSLGAWPYIDIVFVSCLTGSSSWVSLLTTDHASSAFGLSGYEAGSSSSTHVDHLPAHVSAELQGATPAVPVLPLGACIDTDYCICLEFLPLLLLLHLEAARIVGCVWLCVGIVQSFELGIICVMSSCLCQLI